MPASAETVALFLADMADHYRPSTVAGLLSAIAMAHRIAAKPMDVRLFTPIIRGVSRTYGLPPRQAAAITIGDLRAIVANLPDTARGLRDRALLTVGFAGALRRLELIRLDLGATRASSGCVEIDREGAHIRLHKSKCDETGHGLVRWLPRGGRPCPVDALERWLTRASITSGPVFRGVRKNDTVNSARLGPFDVTRIVKGAVYRNALLSGASEHQARARAGEVSSHSLRIGFVASALAAGVTTEEIAEHVGWKKTSMVFYYARHSQPLPDNPARLVLTL
jgi:integrase